MTDRIGPREGFVDVGSANLFVREVGSGQPIIVLHGGAEFDHAYFIPELDRLARRARLVYYDQRGRGRSADGVRPEDVSIGSEMADLEVLRHALGLEKVAVLGHSWGGLLAMEYATRHPDRVSHLVLMNTAPASHTDWTSLRQQLPAMRAPGDADRMRAIAARPDFLAGDLDADAEYLSIHFRPTIRDPELLERVVGRLRLHFDPHRVLLARAIDHRLSDETSDAPGYDLLPRLAGIDTPTLVLHGEHDLIPVDLAAHIAAAMRHATLRVVPGLGHFAFAERPDLVADEIADFLNA